MNAIIENKTISSDNLSQLKEKKRNDRGGIE